VNQQEFDIAQTVLFDIGKSINEEKRMSEIDKNFAITIILNKLSELSQQPEKDNG
jgi:hypothetical protein